MNGSPDWLLLAGKCRSLAGGTDDEELVLTLDRLASNYETKAAAHDFLAGAQEIRSVPGQAQGTPLTLAVE